MPNETPKFKVKNGIKVSHGNKTIASQDVKDAMDETPMISHGDATPDSCAASTQSPKQGCNNTPESHLLSVPSCVPTKQPDDMPDVIYADCFRVKSWTTLPKEALTPYIRKSIHDGGMSLANDIIAKRDNEITKLKSALKECVKLLEIIKHTHFCSAVDMENAITSAKELYE